MRRLNEFKKLVLNTAVKLYHEQRFHKDLDATFEKEVRKLRYQIHRYEVGSKAADILNTTTSAVQNSVNNTQTQVIIRHGLDNISKQSDGESQQRIPVWLAFKAYTYYGLERARLVDVMAQNRLLRRVVVQLERSKQEYEKEHESWTQNDIDQTATTMKNWTIRLLAVYRQSIESIVEGQREVTYNPQFKFEDGLTVKEKLDKAESTFARILRGAGRRTSAATAQNSDTPSSSSSHTNQIQQSLLVSEETQSTGNPSGSINNTQ